MSFIELFLISIGLSMDAFAIAICIGLSLAKTSLKKALIVGLYFGIAQAVMPIFGYFAAMWFASYVALYSDIIVFLILTILGGKMVYGSFQKSGCPNKKCLADACPHKTCLKAEEQPNFSHFKMLTLSIATSIDAMAVGVSFAFLGVAIAPAALLIGVTTLVISMVGVRIGGVVGARFKDRATMVGGIILMIIGIWVFVG